MSNSPFLYSPDSPVALGARERDDAYFAQNPRATWRVRPILEGESLIVGALRERMQGSRAYAVVIDHARAADCRARAGRGVYPIFIPDAGRERARVLLLKEGRRWARWFRKSSSTPTPMQSRASIWRAPA